MSEDNSHFGTLLEPSSSTTTAGCPSCGCPTGAHWAWCPTLKKDCPAENRIADALESLDKRFSHIEDWLGELVTYLKRK